jgi:hypothetical integral membrane protein (TIGR02206 family)
MEIFSVDWWKWLSSTAIIIFLLLFIGTRSDEKQKLIIRYGVAGCLFLSATLIHPYLYFAGIWSIKTSLPLHLCTIAQLLAIVALINPKQWLFNILVFWGIGGGINALITPQPLYGSEFPILLEYFVEHGGIVFTPLFLALAYDMRPSRNSWLKIFFVTQIVIVFIALFNYWTGSNYFFLVNKPASQSFFIIGDWPWYLIGFQVFGFFQFYFIYYIFFKFSIRNNTSSRELKVR